jgi:hypothetical protein
MSRPHRHGTALRPAAFPLNSKDDAIATKSLTGASMTVLRFIGGLFLLVAVIALTADFTRAEPNSGLVPPFASLQKHWSDLAPQSLAAAKRAVEVRAHPFLWDPLIRSVLALPAWASLGTLGLAFSWFGRPRRRIDIFAN